MSLCKKLRLGFRKEHGTEHVALCPNEYKSILNMAGRKLRISNKAFKQARLVLESSGETLLPENTSNLLKDGCVVVVYLQSGKAKQPIPQEVDFLNDLPPVAPSRYSQQHQTEGEVELARNQKASLEATSPALQTPILLDDESETASSATVTLSSLCFDGPFPILEGNILPLVRESVASCKSFVETDFGNYVAFDYKDASFSEVFPNPKQFRKPRQKWLMALRRECRGLLLCKSSGKVLRRPFHKFFNLHEMPETHPDNIPSSGSDDMILLEKVDGSLVSPLLLQNEIVWASRKALQLDLQSYCSSHKDADYEGLARFCIVEHNATPLFEWCQAGQAVGVVLHSTTSVTLLAIRDMISGQYYSRDKMKEIAEQFNVPLVKPLPVASDNIQEIANDIAARPAPLEGGVLIVACQHFYKIKTLWYVSMASATKRASSPWNFLQEFLQKRPSLVGIPSDRIWKAALCDQATDDSRALCKSLVIKEQGDELEHFCQLCDAQVQTLHLELSAWSARLRDRVSNTEKSGSITALASKFVEESGWSEKLLRGYIQDPNISPSNLCQELLQQSRADLESMFGLCWNSQVACVKVDETRQNTMADAIAMENSSVEENANSPCQEEDGRCHIFKSRLFPADSLEAPPKGITDHVCSTYLTRKIANYLGKSKGAIVDETRIEIDPDYVGSEGKLKGMWESFTKKNIVDLRIDLQPPGKELSKHNGNGEWALWLVQYGPNKITKKSSKQKEGWKSGDFAGVFVETNCSFQYRDMRKAVQSSFDERRLVFLGSKDAVSRVPQAETGNSDEKIVTSSTTKEMGNNATPWTLFVDLDGVLADFDGALLNSSGKRPGDFGNPAAMWRHIMSTERDFFATLPWTDRGKQIWKLVLQLSNELESVGEVKILTGVPNNKSGGKSASRQKKTWCNDHLGKDVEVITCQSSEKYKWSGFRCILIDDYLPHRGGWEAAGGSFVHYTGNFPRFERQIRALIYPNGGWSEEQLSAVANIRERAAQKAQETFRLTEDQIFYVNGSEDGMDQVFAAAVDGLSKDFVGVDCEWRPDELHRRSGIRSAASLVQLAFNQCVYLIDLQEISSITRRSLVNLLAPQEAAEWIVIFFGIDEDLNRLLASVPEIVSFQNPETAPAVLDLQRVAASLDLVATETKNLISLSDTMRQVTGYISEKEQSIKACDWSERPLSWAQMHYAACDAQSCLAVLEAIKIEKRLWLIIMSSMTESLVLPTKGTLQKYLLVSDAESKTMEEENCADFENPFPVLSAAPTGSIQPRFSGIFLTKDSSQTLLEAFPPEHRNILADHVTLSFSPSTSALAGLPVGEEVRINVSSIVTDDKSQVARVTFLDNHGLESFMDSNQIAHITMSTAVNIAASRSTELLQKADNGVDGVLCQPTTDLVLDGVVGVMVQLNQDQDLLASVSKTILQKLTDFADNKIPGSTLKFRGGMLSPTERHAIHSFCDANGIQSRSEGPKDNRKMVLKIPKFASLDDSQDSSQFRVVQNAMDLEEDKSKRKSQKKLRAKDARNMVKSYLCVSRDVFSMIQWEQSDQAKSMNRTIFGELCFNESLLPEILIDPNLPEPESMESNEAILRNLLCFGKPPLGSEEPIVIAMRGLPGSGKSSWTKALQRTCDEQVTIVSADSYFEKAQGYQFDANQLGAAHDHCRAIFMEALQNTSLQHVAIIVDNTNSTWKEYQFYIDQAEKAKKRVLTVEMLCSSNDELIEFYKRGLHRVPMQDMGQMFFRWESNEEAFLFQTAAASSVTAKMTGGPSISLRNWLAQNHMFHNNKGRSLTYLNMSQEPDQSKFISVPPHLETEFLRRYMEEDSAWYLAEYATDPRFPFFCDIDQTFSGDQNNPIDMQSVASCLSVLLKNAVIVTGRLEEWDVKSNQCKLGCHLHCPHYNVTHLEALDIRNKLVRMLTSEQPRHDWNAIVDISVYEHMTLRLLGSHKPGGSPRVYDLLEVIGEDGRPDRDREIAYRNNRLQLLLDCSIRIREEE